ncbi:MAG: hypothetical protein U0491_00815 [Candidatus Saccharimonadales bacterium]
MSESVGEAFNEVVRAIGDFELDDDCPTIEHQALKDAVRNGGVRSYSLENFSEKDTINIFTKDGSRLAMRYLSDFSVGRLYLTEASQLLAVRGSFLIDPSQPPEGALGHGVLRRLFDAADQVDDEVVVSESYSVPVVASNHLMIEGGYVAYHLVYTDEQHGERLGNNGDINAADFTYTSPIRVSALGKELVFCYEDAFRLSQFPIAEVGVGKRTSAS